MLDSLQHISQLKPPKALPDIRSGKALSEVPDLFDRLLQLSIKVDDRLLALAAKHPAIRHFVGNVPPTAKRIKVTKELLRGKQFAIDAIKHDRMVASCPVNALLLVVSGNPAVRDLLRPYIESSYPESNPTVRVGMELYEIRDTPAKTDKDLVRIPLTTEQRIALRLTPSTKTKAKAIKVTPYTAAIGNGSTDPQFEEFRLRDIYIDVRFARAKHPQRLISVSIRSCATKESPKYQTIGYIQSIESVSGYFSVRFILTINLIDKALCDRALVALKRLGIPLDLLRHREGTLASMPEFWARHGLALLDGKVNTALKVKRVS